MSGHVGLDVASDGPGLRGGDFQRWHRDGAKSTPSVGAEDACRVSPWRCRGRGGWIGRALGQPVRRAGQSPLGSAGGIEHVGGRAPPLPPVSLLLWGVESPSTGRLRPTTCTLSSYLKNSLLVRTAGRLCGRYTSKAGRLCGEKCCKTAGRLCGENSPYSCLICGKNRCGRRVDSRGSRAQLEDAARSRVV